MSYRVVKPRSAGFVPTVVHGDPTNWLLLAAGVGFALWVLRPKKGK